MKPTFFLLFLLLIACAPKEKEAVDAKSSYHVVGYVVGWKTLKPDEIPAEKLTHINYAFAHVDSLGQIAPMEPRYRERDSLNFLKLQSLKSRNKDLKLLVSIGGWTHSKGFSDAVLTEAGRKKLTQSGIEYLIRHRLDGLDFDWEYPALQGDNNPVRPEDRENFVLMLKSFREALDSLGQIHGNHYLTTIASGGFREYLQANDLAEAQKYLNFVNIMAYDFYTAGDSITGHHANLFSSGPKQRSADTAVKEHLEFGVPAEKLVLGLPFYGRMWRGVPSTENGLFQPGNYVMGLPYVQVLALSKNSAYQRHWDIKAHAPYLFSSKDSTWITYEDPESIQWKVSYIKEKGLAGAMFWELSEDNTGTLLEALYSNFYPQSPVSTR